MKVGTGYYDWLDRVKQYVSEKDDLQDCKDAINQMLNDLTDKVESYRKDTTNLLWFKRSIAAMLSHRMSKYHVHYPPEVPEPQSKYEKFTDLFVAFKLVLYEPLIPSENKDPSYHLDIQPATNSNYTPSSPYAGSFYYQGKLVFICFDDIPYAKKTTISKDQWDKSGSPFEYTSATLVTDSNVTVIGTNSDYKLKDVTVSFSDLVSKYQDKPPCDRPLLCIIDNEKQQVTFKCVQDFELFQTYTTTESSSYDDTGLGSDEDQCPYQCSTTTDPDTGTIEKLCVKSDEIQNIMDQLDTAVKTDGDTIMDFLTHLDALDRALYIMFKQIVPTSVDDVTMKDLAYEAELDKIVNFFEWKIPGWNS